MSTCLVNLCLHSSATKNGFTSKGVQRWKCSKCKKNFTFADITPYQRDLIIKNREKYLRRVIRNKVRYFQELKGFQLIIAIRKRKNEGFKK